MQGLGAQISDRLALRPQGERDRTFLAQLYHSTRDDLRLLDDRDLTESLIEMQHRAQGEGYGDTFPDALYWIIEEQRQPIGRLVVDFSGGEVHIVDLAFIPEARGLGHGKAAIQALQQVAQRMAVPLSLSVHPMNATAKRLYHGLGFRLRRQATVFEEIVWLPPSVSGR